MQSLSVIKHRDILQNILLRLIAGLVVPPLIAFLFKAAKAFRNRNAPTIPQTAHAVNNPMCFQQLMNGYRLSETIFSLEPK